MELAILFGTFVVLLALGVPVAFCLGLSALATLLYLDIPLIVAFQRMAAGIDVFALLAIPFFIFAGELMNQSGIAAKLVRLAESMLGRARGGLGQVSVLSCMMFGAVSGSAVASVSAMGSALTPIMREKGYTRDFAVNVTATGSATGLLIPPSHNMIIYSIAAGGSVSIVSLFLAGVLPGILLGLALMAATWLVAVRRGYPGGAFPGWRQLLVAFMQAAPGLLSAIIIVGGILSGVFTATESSAIAVVYTVVIAVLVYRSLNWSKFVTATRNAVRTTAIVMLIIAAASAFGWLMAVAEVPLRMSEALLGISENPLVLFLIINLILLMLGTFMDMAPLIIITTPIFLPVATQLGMDPVQFGVVMILNLGIGLVTPPVGAVLFVGCAVGGITIEKSLRSIWPFYCAMLVVLLLVTAVPSISLGLPGLFD
ncbi:MAG: TRAP transporter large permease [Gammaproteobacteria bacterium]|nr:TRAP transporter large permease [Gammaproteobacteria bacterium]MXW45318.1 TRAP transporter large permease [Gammaproteobacteria bacterium]MYA31635.1 TRAP transporter large permease [Gammaproteobacteria bacterium]MYD01963.1 TRAP transporter large permease [Gammaproteobacteria bacterium]MYF66381.1 TRAP transporter large permease [Gammaproteobacteria bacterium]